MKKSKSGVMKKYKRTSEKVKVLSKMRTVYLRLKDGVKVVRVKGIYRNLVKVMKMDAAGKKVKKPVKKVRKVKKMRKMLGGDCGCAGTSPSMSGGDVYGRVSSEEQMLKMFGGEDHEGFPALPELSGGRKKALKKKVVKKPVKKSMKKKAVKKVVKKKVVKKAKSELEKLYGGMMKHHVKQYGGEEEEMYGGEVELDGGAKKLEKNKQKELYAKARKYGIKGRSKMSKSSLITAVRAAQKSIGDQIRLRKRKSSKSGKSKKSKKA